MYRVAVLANLKKNAPQLADQADQPEDVWADLDSEHTVDSLCKALEEGGHEVTFVEANVAAIDTIRRLKPDICFNIAEGHYGESREAQFPALLEMLQIPYTGSGIMTQAISLDKPMTKRIWQSYGLSTAPYQVFTTGQERLDPALTFPLFVKPAREGTGKGISASSIVNNTTELYSQVNTVIQQYKQPALVEPHLSGREITVGVIGNRPYQYAMPPIGIETEDVAPHEQGVYGYYMKAHTDKIMQAAKLDVAVLAKVKQMALDAYNAINALDVSRVDIRFDEKGTPYLLEINTTPGLSPGFSDLAVTADIIGKGHTWLVNTILNLACQRYGMPTDSQYLISEKDAPLFDLSAKK